MTFYYAPQEESSRQERKRKQHLTAHAYFVNTCHILIFNGNKKSNNKSLLERERSPMLLRSVHSHETKWCQEWDCGTDFSFAVLSYVFLLLLVNKTQMEHMNSLIFRLPTSLTMTSP